jgi:hypothetical protein
MAGLAEAVTTTPVGSAMPAEGNKRRTLWRWIGVALIVLGLVAGGAIGVATAIDTVHRVDRFPRGAAPGQVSVDVTKTARQVVYYVGNADPSWRELGLKVTAPDGQNVPISDYYRGIVGWDPVRELTSVRERVGGPDSGNGVAKALATFSADGSGRYLITTSRSAASGGEIAAGEDIVGSVFVGVDVACAIALAGLVVGVMLIVTTSTRRSASRVA